MVVEVAIDGSYGSLHFHRQWKSPSTSNLLPWKLVEASMEVRLLPFTSMEASMEVGGNFHGSRSKTCNKVVGPSYHGNPGCN